jgi:tRNA(Leu) C34 or U34 (ribose-2'-O)-methylase TrmL
MRLLLQPITNYSRNDEDAGLPGGNGPNFPLILSDHTDHQRSPKLRTRTMTLESWPPTPRGYFAIGAERSSKALNLGNLMRSAHGFGASFTFTIGASYQALEARADTSKGRDHLPHYDWSSLDELNLPLHCQLVGIELTDDAIDLPSFRHPTRAAYVLGPERGSLSQALIERCDFVVKIPTKFCINVAVAGAIVMYDRVMQMSRFAERPVRAGGPDAPVARHRHGRPRRRAAPAASEDWS